MKISLKREGVFEPTWNKNHDLPVSERTRISFRWPEYGYEADLEKGETTSEGKLTGRGLKTYVSQMVSKFVTKVENLETEDGKVTTAEELVKIPAWNGEDGGTWDLLLEIAMHLAAGQGGVSAKKKTSEELTG